jgi:DNA-binding CsgD family transcriptional regulator
MSVFNKLQTALISTMAQDTQLSEREKEVVNLLLQGKSNKQIALSLNISIRTVEFHLKNVYAKFQVSSRVELILKLVNATGSSRNEKLVYSTVDWPGEKTENKDNLNSKESWAESFGNIVSTIGEEPEMKKRWVIYLLAGLFFGAGYWHYFSITASFFNDISSNEGAVSEGILLIFALFTYFSVWLIPATLPAIYEFRHSRSLRFSVIAVVTVWLSAVLGYYVNYVAMLAFVGLPHMEYLVVFGQKSTSLWQDWVNIFPKLILSKIWKWVLVSVIVGGVAGLITSSVYSGLSKEKFKELAV